MSDISRLEAKIDRGFEKLGASVRDVRESVAELRGIVRTQLQHDVKQNGQIRAIESRLTLKDKATVGAIVAVVGGLIELGRQWLTLRGSP